MTLDGMIELIRSIDQNARRYDAIGQKGDQYTVYSDYMQSALFADNQVCETIEHVQVDYFTRNDDDPVAAAFREAFDSHDEIFCAYDKDFDAEGRYIRHIFNCQII